MSFPILGLTGPSGAGKGVVAERLRDAHGFAWIDTDAVYHQITSSASPCLDELAEARRILSDREETLSGEVRLFVG